MEGLDLYSSEGQIYYIYINYKLRVQITYDYWTNKISIAYYYVHYYNNRCPIILKYAPRVIYRS